MKKKTQIQPENGWNEINVKYGKWHGNWQLNSKL